MPPCRLAGYRSKMLRMPIPDFLVQQVRMEIAICTDEPTQHIVRTIQKNASLTTLALSYSLLDYRLRQSDVNIRDDGELANRVLVHLRDLITFKMILKYGTKNREVYADNLRVVLGTWCHHGSKWESQYLKAFYDATQDVPHAFRPDRSSRRSARHRPRRARHDDADGLD